MCSMPLHATRCLLLVGLTAASGQDLFWQGALQGNAVTDECIAMRRTCYRQAWQGYPLWALTYAASTTMPQRSCAHAGQQRARGSPLHATIMLTASRSSTCGHLAGSFRTPGCKRMHSLLLKKPNGGQHGCCHKDLILQSSGMAMQILHLMGMTTARLLLIKFP